MIKLNSIDNSKNGGIIMDFDIDNEKIQIEKDGKMVDCDILFTFDSEDTMKAYIGYTDHSIAPNGRKNIYISSYIVI